MMMVAGTMIGGCAIVMELIAHVMMIGVMLGNIQGDVRKQHVLMIVLADHGVLDAADSAGNGGLAKDEQQGDAQHRPGSPEQGNPGFHGRHLIVVSGGGQTRGAIVFQGRDHVALGNCGSTPCPSRASPCGRDRLKQQT